MKEVWLPIKDYEENYEVSNLGKIRSKTRKTKFGRSYKIHKSQIIKTQPDKDGYLKVNLSKNGKKKRMFVHRLVAETFIKNHENLPVVNHINGIKDDNRADNLEWCTRSENDLHAFKMGLRKPTNGGMNKRVLQIDVKSNKPIKIFNSIKEASIALGCTVSNLSSCLNGKTKTAKGYKWRFADERVETIENTSEKMEVSRVE